LSREKTGMRENDETSKKDPILFDLAGKRKSMLTSAPAENITGRR